MLAGNTGPLPEKFGAGRLYPCWRTHVTYFSIAWCEIRPKRRPAPKRKFAPHAFKAACTFGLLAAWRKNPPPPPKNPPPGRGAVEVPLLPELGGREGTFTPCCFRQATSAARLALNPEAPDPLADATVEVEVVLAAAPLLLLVLLPQAAIRQAAPTATSAKHAVLDGILFMLNTAFLSWRCVSSAAAE